MGCGVTFTRAVEGLPPVSAPVLSVGYTSCDMNTFQDCPLWLLGSTFLFEPYHTASARPGPPALIHGNTFTASPVPVEPSLTWTGLVHFVQPVVAEAALTKTCLSEGVLFPITQVTNRFLA